MENRSFRIFTFSFELKGFLIQYYPVYGFRLLSVLGSIRSFPFAEGGWIHDPTKQLIRPGLVSFLSITQLVTRQKILKKFHSFSIWVLFQFIPVTSLFVDPQTSLVFFVYHWVWVTTDAKQTFPAVPAPHTAREPSSSVKKSSFCLSVVQQQPGRLHRHKQLSQKMTLQVYLRASQKSTQ